MGGGGAAGTISAPAYMTIPHAWLLDADRTSSNAATGHNHSNTPVLGSGSMNVYDDMWLSRGGPYAGNDAYDPEAALEDLDAEVEAFDTFVTAMSPATDWASHVDSVVVQLERIIAEPETPELDFSVDVGTIGTLASLTIEPLYLDDDFDELTADALTAIDTPADITVSDVSLPGVEVAALLNAFENRQAATHARSVARFASGMNDINAVMSSAFVIGVGLAETERSYEILDYDAKVTLSAAEQELQAELQAALDQRRLLVEGQMRQRDLISAQGTVEFQASGELRRLIFEGQSRKRDLEADVNKDAFQGEIERRRLIFEGDSKKRDIEAQFDQAEFDLKGKLVAQGQTVSAELLREYIGLRVQSYTSGINGIAALLGMKLSGMGEDTKHDLAFSAMKIDAEERESDRNLEIDHLDYTWNLNLFLYFANFMGSIAGSQHVIPNKPSIAAKVLGAAGAVAGMIPGGQGAGKALGAIAG